MEDHDKPAVLVLDDDALLLRSLRRGFRRAGYRVIACHTPEAAFAALDQAGAPAAFVIDFQLGGGWDGAEVAKRLRARPDMARLASPPPLVLYSGALDQVGAEARALFDACLSKRQPLREVLATVSRRLAPADAEGSEPTAPRGAEAGSDFPTRQSYARLKSASRDDEPSSQEGSGG